MRIACLSCVLLAYLIAVPPTAAFGTEPAKFELLDGDRVVFLGNTLIEREQKYGYWELMLTMAWPERNVTFRNLGWSGDTVWGESRAGFGTQADGFKKLVEEVNAAKPTVIFVGYGNVEAFAGEAGLPKFIDGYNKLLDELEKTKARIVMLSPLCRVEEFSPNGPTDAYNSQVQAYGKKMEAIANARGMWFVDLNSADYDISHRTTTNGVDATGPMYSQLGRIILYRLNIPYPFILREKTAELLDAAIVKKNELFFHRWRPQNETYLFGFRKHEQGNNAQEVFAFDPLVAAEEKMIAELRVRLAAEMKKEASDAK